MALTDDEEAALRAELAGAQKALKDVNKESQGHRLAADRANKAAEAAEAERDTAKAEATAQIEAARTEAAGKVTAAETSLAETRTASEARVLRAELRAQATAAGMRDPDDLGALDTSAAKFVEGKVTLPEGYFAKMKEAKPYLFGAQTASTTSSTAKPPAADPGTVKKYDDMTADEQSAWKRQHNLR